MSTLSNTRLLKTTLDLEVKSFLEERLNKFYEDTGIEINEIKFSRRRKFSDKWLPQPETILRVMTDL